MDRAYRNARSIQVFGAAHPMRYAFPARPGDRTGPSPPS
ncbi:hypothetical protein [Nocardia tengchongensis]